MTKKVSGFSKFTKEEKINWLANTFLSNNKEATTILKKYWNEDKDLQERHDEFIENTISNFYIPYAIAPNFMINGKPYVLPMAIEESSVVAAASLVAKFWSGKGGLNLKLFQQGKLGMFTLCMKETLSTYNNISIL